MATVVRAQLAAGHAAGQMAADDGLKAYKAKYSLVPPAVAALQKGALR